MIKAHKIRLDPNNTQASKLDVAAHNARAAYNWGLAEWEASYQRHLQNPEIPKPSQYSIRKTLNSIKRDSMPWLLESTKCAAQEALIDLGKAFTNFFRGTSRRPKFKKRGVSRHAFRVTNDLVAVDGKKVRLPKIGWVRMREELRLDGKIMSATVSKRAGKWYISISVDMGEATKPAAPAGTSTGIDLGVATYATTADGRRHVMEPHLEKAQAKLRRLNRQLHRRKKGSRNREKTKLSLSRFHDRIANQRRDVQHKLTAELASEYQLIGMEDLNVSGMVANRCLSRAISGIGFYETRRQLEYKAAERGGDVIIVGRWFPSSKQCSECGVKNHDLTLSTRYWTCAECGAHHDRDVTAAKNIHQEALRLRGLPAAGSAVAACGGEGSGLALRAKVKPAPVKPAPVKQELIATAA